MTLSGQTPFLQTFPHKERRTFFFVFAMRTPWAVVPRSRLQGPGPSPGHGVHAWSNKGKAVGWLGMISLTLGAAVHARSQGLIAARAVACRRGHAEEEPRPPRLLFAKLVTAARGC